MPVYSVVIEIGSSLFVDDALTFSRPIDVIRAAKAEAQTWAEIFYTVRVHTLRDDALIYTIDVDGGEVRQTTIYDPPERGVWRGCWLFHDKATPPKV